MNRSHSSSVRALALSFATACAVAAILSSAVPSVANAAYPSFVFSGAGYGHGIGLSQSGARAYADRGKSATWIVGHYFPGTTLLVPAAKTVHVNLDPAANYTKSSTTYNGGYTQTSWKIRSGWAGNGLLLSTSSGDISVRDAATPLTFRVSASKVSVTDRSGKKIAGSPFLGTVTVAMQGASAPALLQVVGRSGPFKTRSPDPSTNVRYRGRIEITSNGSRLKLVNAVPMESYLYGVVPREMPASWNAEALKAQAIAARSYAYPASGDMYCDTRSQMYNGYSHVTRVADSSRRHEDSRSNAAVKATVDQCVAYKGDVVATYFCSSSGGYTANKADIWGGDDVPYLRGVPDPYESGSYDPWSSAVTVNGMAFASKLATVISGEPSGAGRSVYVKSISIHRSWPTGFVRTVDVAWSNGAKTSGVSGTLMRIALGMRSNKFFLQGAGGRLSASSKYAEAIAASTRLYPSARQAKSVVIVNGDDDHCPDMASAVALSGIAKGSVLLVHKGSLPSGVSAEIKRLRPRRIYVVGGTGAVSSAVVTKLATLGLTVERLGGDDLYKTAAAVARKAVALGAGSQRVVVCSGRVRGDAVVAAEIAGGSHRPLLFADKSVLPTTTATALKNIGATKSTVVGGSDAIAASTVTQICSITKEAAPAKRLGVGRGQYDTAAEAAAWSVSSLGFSASTVYLASGESAADAFIAAGLAAAVRHPMLLTATYTPSLRTSAYIRGAHTAIKNVTVVGSPAAVGIACALSLQSDGR